MPLDRGGEPDKQGQGVQGLRGERTEDRGVERPELQRQVETQDGPITIQESSGTAFAEAMGAQDKQPPDPEAHGGTSDETFPANAQPKGPSGS